MFTHHVTILSKHDHHYNLLWTKPVKRLRNGINRLWPSLGRNCSTFYQIVNPLSWMLRILYSYVPTVTWTILKYKATTLTWLAIDVYIVLTLIRMPYYEKTTIVFCSICLLFTNTNGISNTSFNTNIRDYSTKEDINVSYFYNHYNLITYFGNTSQINRNDLYAIMTDYN